MIATELEMEAVRLRHSKLRPGSELIVGSPEFVQLLRDVRGRQAQIEQEAFKMLNSRVREGRRFPRRHMMLAFLFVGGIVAVACLAMLLLH
jgi:hypothetical protein